MRKRGFFFLLKIYVAYVSRSSMSNSSCNIVEDKIINHSHTYCVHLDGYHVTRYGLNYRFFPSVTQLKYRSEEQLCKRVK